MARRADLVDWVYEAVVELGGRAEILPIAKHIWRRHSEDLSASGDLFFSWQYDMRWAAHRLRVTGRFAPTTSLPRGVWALSDHDK